MALSKKDVDDLKPMIDRVVRSVMGFSEATLITAAINCLDNGYDRRKTADKLGSIIDERQASGFADRLFEVYDEYKVSSKIGKKRKDTKDEIESTGPKKKRFNEQLPPEPGQPSPGQLTADKIKEMMDSAQRMIKERKVQLGAVVEPVTQPPPPPAAPPTQATQQLLMNDAMEKAKRAAELQARIQAQLANAGLGSVEVKMPPAPAQTQQQQSQPTSFILDEQGRTIDIKTGEAIQLTHYQPTLKANIRAKKREQFKAVIQDKAPEEISDAGFFDHRLGAKAASRQKKSFKFFEKGKFEQLASRLRTKAQLDRLQGEIASAAKKTGIASATKLATLQPKTEGDIEIIPSVEWWDAVVLRNESYSSLTKDPPEGKERFEGITHLIEHPAQMASPADPSKPVQIPVMLTKKERKKLRRQNRNEAQKEVTEKIRLGLIPPPEPKVRMANLMRVLGTEAVQDPTKVEAHVRAQMAKRLKAHEEANANRKLTKEQKSQKKINKIKEDTSLGVHVSVYRVRDLSNPAHKFKVETNAKQLMMTGAVVLHQDCNVVVVEGGPNQQKKFRRLMLHRIKWNEDKHGKVKEDSDSEDDESPGNGCVLVWEGTVKNRSFGDIKFKACPTPSFAKEQFKKHKTEHYWDLAFSGSVLEAAGADA